MNTAQRKLHRVVWLALAPLLLALLFAGPGRAPYSAADESTVTGESTVAGETSAPPPGLGRLP